MPRAEHITSRSPAITKIPGRPVSNRHAPFRVLAHLQFGTYPYLEVRAGGVCTLSNPLQLGRLLKLSAGRVRAAMEWLARNGYLRDFRYDYLGRRKIVHYTLAIPLNLMVSSSG